VNEDIGAAGAAASDRRGLAGVARPGVDPDVHSQRGEVGSGWRAHGAAGAAPDGPLGTRQVQRPHGAAGAARRRPPPAAPAHPRGRAGRSREPGGASGSARRRWLVSLVLREGGRGAQNGM
jgi:hypothetical protein